MKRQYRRVQALAGLVGVLLVTGLAPGAGDGDDDDSPIQKIMEQVHTRNRAIGKGLRGTVAPEAANRKALAAAAASLVQLGKEARVLAGPARERKKSQREWTRAVDEFLQASEEVVKVIPNPGSSQPQATKSYQKLQKTCINCHSAFREGAG